MWPPLHTAAVEIASRRMSENFSKLNFPLSQKKIPHGLVLIWIIVGSLAFVPDTRGGVWSSSFSVFRPIHEGSAQGRPLIGETVQKGYGYAGAHPVWSIANSVSSKSPPLRSKSFRDPFAPIRKTTPVPKPPSPPKVTKSPVPAPPVPGKLLSVVHGPWGYQAVIQLSPKEYLIVEPGEPVANTGWRVKEIKDDRVRLELIPSLSPSGGVNTIKTANLFFK